MRITSSSVSPSTRRQQLKAFTTRAVLFVFLAVACTTISHVKAASNSSDSYQFDIPSLKVDQALNRLAEKTGHQLLFSTDLVGSLNSTVVQGQYTASSALNLLLQGTSLTGNFTERGVIIVTDPNAQNNIYKGRGKMNTKKSLLAAMVGLLAGTGATTLQAQDGGEGARAQSVLDEIIITATRREAGLNDTALSVAAIGGEEISRRDLTEMNDYLRTLPGVNLFEAGVGTGAVVVRGLAVDPSLSANDSGPSSGIYFGEVSLGGGSSLGGSADLKMIDLERIEVLRGPQGTLFGSSSLAGAVRNIPNAPNLEELEGSIKTGYSNTSGFGGTNTKLEGVINIPLIDDVLAVRAVAYRHDNSGFIKNIAGTQLATNGRLTLTDNAADAVASSGGAELFQDRDDVGATVHEGGRIAALWKPMEELEVTLQYITQDVEQEEDPFVQLFLGDFEHAVSQVNNNIPALSNVELGLKDDISITNLVARYDLGWATILSSSSWIEEESELNRNLTHFFGGAPTVIVSPADVDSFSQELRLVSQLDGPFQYVAGVYYEDTDNFSDAPIYAMGDLTLSPNTNPNVGPTDPLITAQSFDRTLEQLSFYGELSYDLTEQLTLTGGLRRFDYERGLIYSLDGAFGTTLTDNLIEESGTTFKVNLSYMPNDDTLIYGQWAEGFRLGNGVNSPSPDICDVNNDGNLDGTNTPIRNTFDSDNTESIELGVKLGLLENRLQVNAAVYRVNWQGIPLTIFSGKLPSQPSQICFSGIVANAGEAISQGMEIETTYQLNENLRISLGGAYTDAELDSVSSDVPFSVGDRLPSAPEYSVNLGLQYDFVLGGYASYVQADYAYVSDYFGGVGETAGDIGAGPTAAGDYGQFNMSAGVVIDRFNVELVARNLANENGFTHIGSNSLRGSAAAYRLRPRTIGLNVSYQF